MSDPIPSNSPTVVLMHYLEGRRAEQRAGSAFLPVG
jgi:hypothetical protein